MSYEVLARKLRPSDFSALVGQEHMVKALSHALDSGRLHQRLFVHRYPRCRQNHNRQNSCQSLNYEQGVSSTPVNNVQFVWK